MQPFLLPIAYFLSAVGWGRLVVAWALPNTPLYPALSAALGLVLVAFVGGVFTAAHAITPTVLDALVVIGWVLCAIFAFVERARLRAIATPDRARDLPLIVFLLVTLGFLANTLLPGTSLNIFDDFYTYLALPIRLLDTGTLAGNPFDGAGSSALGAQAFFQAFILRWFPLANAIAFDSIFCLVLAAALVAEIAHALSANRIVQFCAAILYLTVNPAIVNLTSVYSGSLMILTLVSLTIALARAPDNRRLAFAIGAVTAILVVFKITYFLVAVVYWVSAAAISRRFSGHRLVGLKTILYGVFAGVIVLLPWVAIYVPDTLSVVLPLAQNPASLPPYTPNATVDARGWNELLSFKPFIYGATYGAYGVAFATLVLIFALALLRRRAGDPIGAITTGALALAGLVSVGLSSFMTDFQSVLRFGSPVLSAALALAAIWSGLIVQTAPDPTSLREMSLFHAARRRTILLVPIAIFAVFAGSLYDRVTGALGYRTLIAYPVARQRNYQEFLNNALSTDYKTWITGVQNRIPANEPIFAWTSASFLMDFQRNPILIYAPQAYTHPYLAFPPPGEAASITRALKDLGVRYIVWEYSGYTIIGENNYMRLGNSPFALWRRINYSMLRMLNYMKYIAPRTSPVYIDNRMAVFDINAIPE